MLTLAEVLGKTGDDVVKAITKAGQLVFHAVGDTGSVKGPENISLVADKMAADFDDEAPENVPHFFFHLGDVIYNFGETQYYYDQFYEPYREYPAPIIAIAGNHDGMVAPGANAVTLTSFLNNFCATEFEIRPRPAACREPRKSSPACSTLSKRPCCGSSPSIPTCSRTLASSRPRNWELRNWITSPPL